LSSSSKSDLRARPIYHHKRDSIEAHLTIVMAALALSHWLQRQTGWSIKKLVRTVRHYRSIAVQTGSHILRAGTPLATTPEPPSTSSRMRPVDTKLSQVRTGCDRLRRLPPAQLVWKVCGERDAFFDNGPTQPRWAKPSTSSAHAL
jgi:hypothetical protein